MSSKLGGIFAPVLVPYDEAGDIKCALGSRRVGLAASSPFQMD